MAYHLTFWGAVLGALLLCGAVWMYQDYKAWLAFGTGGTPANLQGYLKITKFRILRILSGDNLKDHSSLSSKSTSYLRIDLPLREGPSPKIVSRTLPQRQHPVPLNADCRDHLHDLPRKYAAKLSDVLVLDKSVTEGRSTDAIYAKPDRKTGAIDSILGHEIAHVHPADNSLHVWLTQADAKRVVAAGWGERFPLASLGMVDPGWTFVYAPRSMDEVAVVEEIIRAGIGHLTGRKID